ncbi:unnamed protein product [Cylicocyclus nassatus]|uniref:G-protein coupled receptors family 1 profile domain-containing protein n=1 Tax=Cylicocyclus nassatus TaxID=53992 RepID=A0AA36H6P2_CYLNA|nr:unnamed protein product [Cylicocyclus nassatus]
MDHFSPMNNEELCEEAHDVASSLILRCALILNVVCALVAVPLIILVIRATLAHKLVHHNVKWILVFHLCCLVTHDIFRIANHIWDLVVFFQKTPNDCNLYPRNRCLAIRVPINVTIYLAYTTTFVMSIERCFATWKLNSYGQNKIVGPVLVLVQIIAAAVCMFIILNDTAETEVMPYCLLTSLSSSALIFGPISVLLSLQIVAVIVFEVLMRINRKKSQRLLHGRSPQVSDGVISRLYQVRENLRTMKTLMLFFLLSCINSFFYNCLRGFVHLNKPKFARSTFYALIEVSIHLPQYSLLLPAVLWYSYRKVAKNAAARHQEKLDRDAPENTKLHFNMITESWK